MVPSSVIKYVVFVNPVRCEVIRTENIPYLISLMPWDYCIYPMQVSTFDTLLNIEIPVSFTGGDENNDKT